MLLSHRGVLNESYKRQSAVAIMASLLPTNAAVMACATCWPTSRLETRRREDDDDRLSFLSRFPPSTITVSCSLASYDKIPSASTINTPCRGGHRKIHASNTCLLCIFYILVERSTYICNETTRRKTGPLYKDVRITGLFRPERKRSYFLSPRYQTLLSLGVFLSSLFSSLFFVSQVSIPLLVLSLRQMTCELVQCTEGPIYSI